MARVQGLEHPKFTRYLHMVGNSEEALPNFLPVVGTRPEGTSSLSNLRTILNP